MWCKVGCGLCWCWVEGWGGFFECELYGSDFLLLFDDDFLGDVVYLFVGVIV